MTKKQVKEFFATIAELKYGLKVESRFWVSKTKGIYLCAEGDELRFKFLLKFKVSSLESTNGKICNIAYSDETKSWVGWSHRACAVFKVGSKVEKGDIAYSPKNEKDWIADQISFWIDKECETFVSKEIKNGQLIIVSKYNNKVPNAALKGTSHKRFITLPTRFNGRGEWVAKTLADAKQMAIDFANNIA